MSDALLSSGGPGRRKRSKSRLASVIPENKDGIGYIIWEIIGGKAADTRSAAKLLGVSTGQLNDVIYNKTLISSRLIEERNWRGVFQKNFPEKWTQHEQKFNALTAKLPAHIGRQSFEPENKDSAGYWLWLIVGGKNIRLKETAKLLNVGAPTLSMFIHDRRKVSQQTITDNQWFKKLAEKHHDTWSLYGGNLKAAVKKLSIRRGSFPREPENKDSLGHVIWRIAGGTKANLDATAKLVGISTNALADIVHGVHKPAPRTMRKIINEWPAKLQATHPSTWIENKDDFNRHVRLLASPMVQQHVWRHSVEMLTKPAAIVSCVKDDWSSASVAIRHDWRLAVGQFVKTIVGNRYDLDDSGTGVDSSVLQATATHIQTLKQSGSQKSRLLAASMEPLQEAGTWQQIFVGQGDPKIFQGALEVVGELYRLQYPESERLEDLKEQYNTAKRAFTKMQAAQRPEETVPGRVREFVFTP